MNFNFHMTHSHCFWPIQYDFKLLSIIIFFNVIIIFLLLLWILLWLLLNETIKQNKNYIVSMILYCKIKLFK